MHSEKVHRHKRKSLFFFLFQSNYIQLQSVVPSIKSRKHTIKAIPSKKKIKKTKKEKEKERMKRRRRKEKRWKREEEEKGMERVCAEGKGKGENEV